MSSYCPRQTKRRSHAGPRLALSKCTKRAKNLGLVELRNVRRYVPEYGYLLHYSVFHLRQASFFAELLLLSDIRGLNSTEWRSAIRIGTNVWRNIKLLYVQ